jgi:hypothetical protein
LLAALAVGCSDVYEKPETHYMIQAGEHGSHVVGGFFGDKMRTLKSNHFSFSARFDETARYQLSERNQGDINKLMGFADANSLHHENSIRFGWRYAVEKDAIEIFAYAYNNKERDYQYMTDIKIGETATFQIMLTDNSYELSVNGEANTSMSRTSGAKVGIYYLLFPYFGGNEAAPHNINVFVQEYL